MLFRNSLTINPSSFDELIDEFLGITKSKNLASLVDKDGKYYWRVEVPGFSEDEIKVSIEGNILTVSGKCERKDDPFVSVTSQDLFYRSVLLPKNADVEGINAEMKHGILYISLPKKELKGKEIKVKLLK